MAAKQRFGPMFRRAILLKCPWCASRRTFIKGWFRRYDRCRTCGIQWRREEGFELGAVTMNTIITFGLLVIGMAIGFIVTYPDVPVWPLVLGLSAIVVIVPVLVYPFTYTIWLAFDLAVHRPDEQELAQARSAVEPAQT